MQHRLASGSRSSRRAGTDPILLAIGALGCGACGRLEYVPGPDAGALDAGGLDAAVDAPAPAASDVGLDAQGDAPETGPPAIVFRSRSIDGAFGGVARADEICAEDAAAAGLVGTFVAYVTTVGGPSPSSRLGGASGWARPDGLAVALSREALSIPLLHPIVLLADGTPAAGSAWLGTTSDCDGWTSTAGSTEIGQTSAVMRWDGPSGATTITSCRGDGSVYCFQTDPRPPPVSTAPTLGRLVFVSDSTTHPAIPDAVCETSRARAGLTGTFRAVVAMPGARPLDRVVLDGRPWVRLDGQVVFPADPTPGELAITPVLFDAASVPDEYDVSIGASSLFDVGTANETCDGWTTSTSTDQRRGVADDVGPGGFGTWRGLCVLSRFYCLAD